MKNSELELWQEKLKRLESARQLATDDAIKVQLDGEIQKSKEYVRGLEDTKDRLVSELKSSSANSGNPQVNSLLSKWDEYKKTKSIATFF